MKTKKSVTKSNKRKKSKRKSSVKDVCRICLNNIIGQRFLINTKGPHNSLTFAQMYFQVSGFEANDDPSSLCWGCAKELTSAYKIMKKVEDKERIGNFGKVPMMMNQVETNLGEKPAEFENVVIKVEPLDYLEEEGEVMHDEYEPNILGYKAPNKNNSGSLIQCVLCYYNTYSKKYYQKHVLFHHRHQRLKCDGCQEEYQFVDDLNEHRKESHDFSHKYVVNLISDDLEPVPVKQEVFEIPPIKKPDKSRFKVVSDAEEMEDVKSSTEVIPRNRVCQKTGKRYEEKKISIKCPLCSYSCVGKSNFRSHYKTQHKNQELKCDGCDEKFCLFYRLYQHREKQHNFTHEYIVDASLVVPDEQRRTVRQGADYPCPQCDLVIKGARDLYKHLRIVHKFVRPKPSYEVICDFCGKLVIKHNLERHIRHVHPEHRDPYICDYCGETRKSDCAMMRHFQSVHKLAQKPRDNPMALICKYCPETFTTRHQREAHEIRSHTFNYKYICSICDKKFLKNSHRNDHMKRHANQKMNKSNISCKNCGKSFSRKSFLKEHLTMCT